jgi:hypothetical protein
MAVTIPTAYGWDKSSLLQELLEMVEPWLLRKMVL